MRETTNITIAICDDELQIISDISNIVSETIPRSNILQFSNGKELLEAIENKHFDLLLLDIDMPEITGLDIAKEISHINPKPLVVFVTSHDELVYDSLQYHPFGFVRKTYMKSELPKVLIDSISEIEKKENKFHFRTATDDVNVRLEDILYFESDGNYIKLFSMDNEYRFRGTMLSIEKTLEVNGFVRIHKGFVVNQAAVKMINADECILVDGQSLPVGRNYSENARKKMMRYMIR